MSMDTVGVRCLKRPLRKSAGSARKQLISAADKVRYKHRTSTVSMLIAEHREGLVAKSLVNQGRTRTETETGNTSLRC